MRLTLRTLLAYRDGVLSPADNEDLHRRIQKSDYAGNMLRRINAVTKRSYATSTIVGKGLGGDPNAYAEYLDDVLQSEKIPEFERICLESDEHLAELAASHSSLCSAMQKTVRVPDSLRQTALKIGDENQRDSISQGLSFRKQRGNGQTRILRTDTAHKKNSPTDSFAASPQKQQLDVASQEEQKVQVQAPMVASGGGSIKPQGLDLEDSALAAEVPAYLIGTTPRNWRTPLAIGALLALLAILIWQALGPWDRVRELFVAQASNAGLPNAGLPGRGDAAEGVPTAANEADRTANLSPPEQNDDGLADSVDGSSSADARSESGTSESPAESQIEKTAEIQFEESEPPGLESSSSPDESGTVSAVSAKSGTWLPNDDEQRAAVLLALADDTKLRRLRPGDSFYDGEQLIVPPHYRTTLDMPGGVLWTSCGPTVMTAGSPDGVHVTTALCRALIRSGPLGRELNLASPAGNCRITLQGADSTASLEVCNRPKTNGSVLDGKAHKPVLIIIAVEGQTQVKLDSGIFDLGLGQGLALIGDTTPREFKLQSIPAWYRAGHERPIDRIAAQDLDKLLVPGADAEPLVEDELDGLTRNPKPYLAALAIQTSMLTGNWEPLIQNLLPNPRFSSYWESALDLARQLLATEPTKADEIRGLFSSHSPQGDTLFQMLVGFSEEELTNERMAMLVSQLGDDHLENRVLASYQLKMVTGKGLAYLPHEPNRASIQLWRRELTMNRLQVRPVGDIIAERIAH